MDITKFLTEIKSVPLYIIFWICVTSGIVLFIPSFLVKKLLIEPLITEYGMYIGAIFIVSLTLIIVIISIKIINYFRNLYFSKKHEEYLIEKLNNLSPQEQAVIREFMIQQSEIVKLPIDNPVVHNLIEYRILRRASNYGYGTIGEMIFNVSLSKRVDTLLTPEMIGLSSSELTERDMEWIQNNRPNFLRNSYLLNR